MYKKQTQAVIIFIFIFIWTVSRWTYFSYKFNRKPRVPNSQSIDAQESRIEVLFRECKPDKSAEDLNIILRG